MDSDFSHKPSELNRNLKKLINENLIYSLVVDICQKQNFKLAN